MPNHDHHARAASARRVPWLWRAYRPAVWLVAIASTVALTVHQLQSADAVHWRVVVTLVALGNLADLAAVRVHRTMRVSAAHFAAPFAVIAASTTGGLITAGACLGVRMLRRRADWNRFDVAVNLCATAAAAMAWQLSQALTWSGGIVVGSVAAVSTFALVRSLINFGWANEARANGAVIPPVTVPIGRIMLAAALLFTPAIALFAVGGTGEVGALTMLVLPFVASQFLIGAFGREVALNTELEDANVSLTESLVTALDARDDYSAGHSIAVAVYSRDLAAAHGLSDLDVQRTYLSGLLHDIGKIAVPDAILRKPGALTDDEFEEMSLHPVIGEQILAPSRHLRDVLPGVRHHHERIDGAGYPDGLRGDEIPLQARIIAVADCFHAMTSVRPYRDAMPWTRALELMTANEGSQHDVELVGTFRELLEQRGEAYASGTSSDFERTRRMRGLLHEADASHRLAGAAGTSAGDEGSGGEPATPGASGDAHAA